MKIPFNDSNDQSFIDKHLRFLNPEQRMAACTTSGHVLLLAVPGSGKTTTIIAHLGYLIFVVGIKPANILTITYTNAATKDLINRFQENFGKSLSKAGYGKLPEFRTINSLSNSIIRHYTRTLARTPFDLIQDKTAAALLRSILRSQGTPFPTEADISDLATKISYIKNMMLTDKEIAETYADENINISICYKTYCNALRKNKLMDYDDQMVIAKSILLQYPKILEYFQNKYKYICVDEAQDTSKIQHEIIKLLALGSGNLLMVGDEDQSIYGFRAAFPEALLNFKSTYPDSRVMHLSNNYRSTPSIIKKSKAFIKLNTRRTEKEMREVRKFDAPLHVETLKNRHAQYEWLLNMIKNRNITTQGDKDLNELASSKHYSVAVLFRNNESALPLVDMLERHQIPYNLRSFETSFFTHIVVQDILNTIALAFDLNDYEKFMNMYYKFGLMISKDQARLAVHQAQEKLKEYECSSNNQMRPPASPWSILIDNAAGTHKNRLSKFIVSLGKICSDNGSEAVHRILYEMGYAEFLEQRQMGTEKAEILAAIGAFIPAKDLPKRLHELEKIILKRHHTGTARVIGSRIATEHEIHVFSTCNSKKETEFGITISTIHSAKGLEFDSVVLFDMLPGIMPGAIPDCVYKKNNSEKQYQPDVRVATSDSAALEEERRLFYVAATRAKNHLYMFKFHDGSSPFVLEYLSGKKALNNDKNLETKEHILDKSKYTGLAKNSAEYKAYLTAYNKNSIIIHKKFGEGLILDIKNDIITIKFINANPGDKTKKFSISALEKLDLIDFPDDSYSLNRELMVN